MVKRSYASSRFNRRRSILAIKLIACSSLIGFDGLPDLVGTTGMSQVAQWMSLPNKPAPNLNAVGMTS
jgi:hypothetical protein